MPPHVIQVKSKFAQRYPFQRPMHYQGKCAATRAQTLANSQFVRDEFPKLGEEIKEDNRVGVS
jgi:hypothetical protein